MRGPGAEMSSCNIVVDQVTNQFLEMFDAIRLVARDDQYDGVGRSFLASVVRSIVDARRPIGLVLPAFPAKSPNVTKKVLGSLPDRAEELAFGVLEHFCRDVEKFYPPGAEVVIFSDGRVFSDLLGITSETVTTYQKECMRMVRDLGYTHISFDDLENHLAPESELGSTDQAELIRMLQGESPAVDVDALLASDAEQMKLHQSIKCFLRLDLEPSIKADLLSEFPGASQKRLKVLFKAKCKEVSISMMLRNMAFSKLVGEAYPDMIRISIHAHTNAGPKFGICLTPGQDRSATAHTPWHNCVVESSDGQIHIMKREMVDLTKYEAYEHPVYNRPWGFREKSSEVNKPCRSEGIRKLLTTAEGVPEVVTATDVRLLANLPVEVKHLQPRGIMVRCMGPSSMTPLDIPSETMRRLILQFGVVLLREFQDGKGHGDNLVAIADKVGEIVYETVNVGAGLNVKEVAEVRDRAMGSVMSSQALPFHRDGSFKSHNSQTLHEVTHAGTPRSERHIRRIHFK